MKIIKAFPPNFSEIAQRFPVKGKQGILYAWGDTIYNPSDVKMLPWILAHESVHGERMKALDEKYAFREYPNWEWWKQYMADPAFRLCEEILAHRAEWRSYSENRPGSIERQWYLDMMGKRLSGPLYGNMISQGDAEWEITQ